MTKKQVVKKVKLTKKQQEVENAKSLLIKSGIMFAEEGESVVNQTTQDLRSAVLIVSLTVNMVVFLMWLILQYTQRYDVALAKALFNR